MRQHLRQGLQRILLLQKADGFQRLRVGAGCFAEVGGIAVGVAVDLVPHLLDGLLRIDLRCRLGCPHKRQNALHVGAALDVNQVHAVAAGVVGRKLVLGQQRFKVSGEIGAAR